MAGLKVVSVKVQASGELDMGDLRAKAEKHKDNLAAFMITYPSTFGVFEEGVQEACKIIHDAGGQVYLDGLSPPRWSTALELIPCNSSGANLNAQMGLTNPNVCGGDVCHLNLHKTFGMCVDRSRPVKGKR